MRYTNVHGSLRPQHSGIAFPAAAAGDFRIALGRRRAKSLGLRSTREVEFSATRVDGCAVREDMAASFLRRIGFPANEIDGDLFRLRRSETLAKFKAGLSEDAIRLLGLPREELEKVAGERGVRLTSSSLRMVYMVQEIGIKAGIAAFLGDSECRSLVAAVPSFRGPVYACIRRKGCWFCQHKDYSSEKGDENILC